MNWCSLMKMWCSDMEDEDIKNADCDGECEYCCECENVKVSEK